jgi:hypothetical protein
MPDSDPVKDLLATFTHAQQQAFQNAITRIRLERDPGLQIYNGDYITEAETWCLLIRIQLLYPSLTVHPAEQEKANGDSSQDRRSVPAHYR